MDLKKAAEQLQPLLDLCHAFDKFVQDCVRSVASTGVITESHYRNIMARIFGKAVESFEATVLLCDRGYWGDACVLARCLMEAAMRLKWLSQDPEARADQFVDEAYLKEWHLAEAMGGDRAVADGLIRRERYAEIKAKYQELLVKYQPDKVTKSLRQILPDLRSMARAIGAENDYDLHYRDLSGGVHSDAWGLATFGIAAADGSSYAKSGPDLGRKALLVALLYTFQILELWTRVFGTVPEETLKLWSATLGKALTELL